MKSPNLNYIRELSGGDQDFEKKIIEIIKKEFPEEKKVYFHNYNSNNYKLAADNVHKLKHKFSILGLGKGYEIAIAFENNLLKGDTNLNQEFESVLMTITNYLQKL
jgi:HPt (histidine-containing phosphotransfer) domain-containing protein